MRRLALLFSIAATMATGCNGSDTPNDEPRTDTARTVVAKVPEFTFRLVHQYPHDTSAFTQGLVFHEGRLFESTGLNGRSSLREVELETGRVIRKVDMHPTYFGEGLALHDGRLYQITWRNYTGFVYDMASFKQLDTFSYYGEGWGIASDGTRLVMSDGSSTLRFINPADMTIADTRDVVYPGRGPLGNLNELEWIEGEIWANVYTTQQIVRINPATGAVMGIVDLSGILPEQARTGSEDVLNGIAYDPATKRIFVTGKLWPFLFEIQVVPRSA
jgi:glutaminyl-peptide cyclotransferase